MSLAQHGKGKKDNKGKGGSKNKVDFGYKKPPKGNTEDNTDTGTDNSTVESTEETDLSSMIKAKLGTPGKKPEKKQISAWIEPAVYKQFKNYKGNGDKGQKSELVNSLLKIYFGIED